MLQCDFLNRFKTDILQIYLRHLKFQIENMSDKIPLTTPEYLKDLYGFIKEKWKKIPNGSHYQKKKLQDISAGINEPKGGYKDHYFWYVNITDKFKDKFNMEAVENIRDRLEFIVLVKFEEILGKGAFDDWRNNKNNSEKIELPKKALEKVTSEIIEEKNDEIVEILITGDSFTFDETKISYQHAWKLTVEVFIQNFGSRPIVFKECALKFEAKMITDSMGRFYFNLKQYQIEDIVFDTRGRELVKPIIIKGNDVKYINFVFYSMPVDEGLLLLLKPCFSMGGPFYAQIELLSIRDKSFKSNKVKECR